MLKFVFLCSATSRTVISLRRWTSRWSKEPLKSTEKTQVLNNHQKNYTAAFSLSPVTVLDVWSGFQAHIQTLPEQHALQQHWLQVHPTWFRGRYRYWFIFLIVLFFLRSFTCSYTDSEICVFSLSGLTFLNNINYMFTDLEEVNSSQYS